MKIDEGIVIGKRFCIVRLNAEIKMNCNQSDYEKRNKSVGSKSYVQKKIKGKQMTVREKKGKFFQEVSGLWSFFCTCNSAFSRCLGSDAAML